MKEKLDVEESQEGRNRMPLTATGEELEYSF